MSDDITTKPGLVARSRKAIVAFVGATAASIGPAVAVAGADSKLDWAGEIIPLSVVGLTLGFAAAAAVWATPNASSSRG